VRRAFERQQHAKHAAVTHDEAVDRNPACEGRQIGQIVVELLMPDQVARFEPIGVPHPRLTNVWSTSNVAM
jgi:hypothetical protein